MTGHVIAVIINYYFIRLVSMYQYVCVCVCVCVCVPLLVVLVSLLLHYFKPLSDSFFIIIFL